LERAGRETRKGHEERVPTKYRKQRGKKGESLRGEKGEAGYSKGAWEFKRGGFSIKRSPRKSSKKGGENFSLSRKNSTKKEKSIGPDRKSRGKTLSFPSPENSKVVLADYGAKRRDRNFLRGE